MDKINTPYDADLLNVRLPDLTVLNGANVLVTGATGLIGSALVDLLLLYAEDFNFNIYAGCRRADAFNSRFKFKGDRLHLFILDVTQPIESNIEFTYIIHAASGATPTSYAMDPVGVMKANILGVCNLMDYGIAHNLKRFIYISSGEVYGERCPEKWTEQDSGYVNTMSMRSCYPSSKRAAETLCVAYANQYGVDTVVARICHTYGPRFSDKDNRVYAQFIRNVLKGEDIVLKSKGEPYRSWLYVVDCVAALLYILINGKNGEAYNVANEESNITIRQLADIVAEIAGMKVVFDLPDYIENIGATPITKAVFDTTKLNSLGWTPVFPIKKGLCHTINSIRFQK